MTLSRFRACKHQAVTISIFLCTLVSFFERIAFSIAFTTIAERNSLTETEKGLTLSSYYFGFTVSQVPGGYMTKRCGGKAILGLSFLLWAPLSGVLAATTRSGYAVGIVVACRLGIGLAQGILLPAAQSVLGHWTPAKDRGRHFAFAMSGMFAGAAIAMVTVPSVVSRFGAHTAFYVSACLGAAWLAGWIFTGSDAPVASEGETDFGSTTSGSQQQLGEDEEEEEEKEGGRGARSVSPTPTAGSDDGVAPIPRRDYWAAAGVGKAPAAWNFHNPAAAVAAAHTSAAAVAGSAPCTCRNPGHCCSSTESIQPRRCCLDQGSTRSSWSERVFRASGFGSNSSSISISSSSRGGSSARPRALASKLSPANTSGEPAERTDAGTGDGVAEAVVMVLAEQQAGREGSGGSRTGEPCCDNLRKEGDDTVKKHLDDRDRGSVLFREPAAFAPPLLLSPAVTTLGSEAAAATTTAAGNFGPPPGHEETKTEQSLVGSTIGTTGCAIAPSSGHASEVGGTIISSEIFVATRAAAGGGQTIGLCGVSSGQDEKGAGVIRVLKETTLTTCWGEGKAAHPRCGDLARRVAFPWRGMCASPAAWGCVAGNVGAGMAINVVMSWLPTYYEEFILTHLEDIHTVALLSPYLTMMAFSILGGVAYCWLTNTRGFSRALASRVISGAAFTLSVAVFPCFGLARSSATATILSSLTLASAALSRGGWSTKHMEIAANPDHAAMLYSVANTISAAASVAGISATGKLLDTFGGGGVPRAWTVAMGAVGAACGVCGVVFVFCARGDEILFPLAGTTDDEAVGGVEETKRGGRSTWAEWRRWPWGEEEEDVALSWPQPFGWTADMSPA